MQYFKDFLESVGSVAFG